MISRELELLQFGYENELVENIDTICVGDLSLTVCPAGEDDTISAGEDEDRTLSAVKLTGHTEGMENNIWLSFNPFKNLKEDPQITAQDWSKGMTLRERRARLRSLSYQKQTAKHLGSESPPAPVLNPVHELDENRGGASRRET